MYHRRYRTTGFWANATRDSVSDQWLWDGHTECYPPTKWFGDPYSVNIVIARACSNCLVFKKVDLNLD